MRPCFTRWR